MEDFTDMHDDLVKFILIKEGMDDKDDHTAFDEIKSKCLYFSKTHLCALLFYSFLFQSPIKKKYEISDTFSYFDKRQYFQMRLVQCAMITHHFNVDRVSSWKSHGIFFSLFVFLLYFTCFSCLLKYFVGPKYGFNQPDITIIANNCLLGKKKKSYYIFIFSLLIITLNSPL